MGTFSFGICNFWSWAAVMVVQQSKCTKCHWVFHLKMIKMASFMCESVSRSVLSDSVIPWIIQSMEFSRPEYGVGSLSFPQGIFPTQGSNPGLPHCRWILYQLNHDESPRISEWVTYPFSSRSCQWILYQLSYQGSPNFMCI